MYRLNWHPRWLASLAFAALAGIASGQGAYPTKVIKIIAPVQPGGGVDLVGRTVADRSAARARPGGRSSSRNQSGGGGIVGSVATARAVLDGDTLMVGYVATHGTSGRANSRTTRSRISCRSRWSPGRRTARRAGVECRVPTLPRVRRLGEVATRGSLHTVQPDRVR